MFVHRRGRTATVLLVAMLALAGCSSGSGSDATPRATVATTTPTTRPVTTTTQATTTTLSPKEEVIAAYLAAQKQFYEIAADPEADLKSLEEHRTGAALSVVSSQLQQLRADDDQVSFPGGHPVATVTDVAISGSKATLVACTPNDVVVTGANGQLVDGDVYTAIADVTLERAHGRWLVTTEQVKTKRPGLQPCQ